jgi:hypothetical protein
VIIVLLWCAITLPYRIAFYANDNKTWTVLNYIVDGTFLLDMILTFFTVTSDPKTGGYITDRRVIALDYLKSWFIIDLISILPLDKIMQNISVRMIGLTKFSRFARFARLIKFFRILRLARMFRLCKDRKRIARTAQELITID